MDDPSIPEVLLERFGQSYGHIKNIHAALRKMEGASITDETMERLSISVSKMEMETGSPSPYFTPSAQQMPDPLQEKLEDDPFANQEWNWGPPASRWPPYFFLMQAFLYYQTSMKWLNRYLPEDQEDGKSPEKNEEETSKENMRQEENDEKELNGKQEGNESPDGSEEHMSQEDMREKENDENELNGQQEGPGSPEWSEEHMCGHEETSEWDSDEESEKESEEHLKQRRKRRAELRRLYEERQRKIYEAEEARMVYEWNVYHYPGTYSYKPLENHHDFDIIRTGHRNNPLQCHQWVVALVDVSDENRPSITELVVLANRMLKAMNLQKRRLSTSQNDNNQFHHLFPTTIVTFDKYNRARVLSGYYDGGLKVHFTEPLDFDERTRYVFQGSLFERDWVSDPYYAEMMRRLAAWTWPKAQMNTAQTFTLPIISEGIGNGDHEL